MFLYTYYKLYNNESHFFCAIKSQFFVFLLKFGKLLPRCRVCICRFWAKRAHRKKRPAAKRKRAERFAAAADLRRTAAFCTHFAYTLYKKRTFFCKNRTMLRACFCRLRLCGQFRQGKRRPNGGALWRPNKNRAEHSPCTAFCLLSALPRLKSRRLRGCPGSGECGPAISAEKASAYRRRRKRPCFRARIRGFRWSCARSRAPLWRLSPCPER